MYALARSAYCGGDCGTWCGVIVIYENLLV